MSASHINRFKLRPISAALVAALAAPAAVYAQQPEALLPEVEVRGKEERDYNPGAVSSPKYTAPLRDTPQTITVVPKQVFEDRGATTLREVLDNASGISLTAGEGNPGGGDQLKLRGFAARDDIMLDGVRNVGGYFRDPYNLEAVEVGKGPSSSYTGRGSTGGYVNMVSKSPRREEFQQASATLGSDATRRLTTDLNLAFGDSAAWRLNAMGHENEVAGRDEVFNERWGIAPSVAFGLGTATRTTLSYSHMRQNNLPDYGIPLVRDSAFANSGYAGQPAPVDYSNFYGYTQRDYEDIVSRIATLGFEHDFSGNVSVRNQLRRERLDNDSVVSAPRIQNNTGGQINENTNVVGNGKPRDQTDKLLINQTDVTLKFDTGAVRHAVVTGVELARQQLENRRRLDVNGYTTNLFNPDPNQPLTAAQMPVYNGTRAKFDTDSAALYAFDTLTLSEQWQLIGGLRWDRVESRVQGIDDTGANPGYVTDKRRTDKVTSWRTAAVYKPAATGSVYLGVGTSFDPLASAAANAAGVVQPAGGNNNSPAEAGFDVAPEKSRIAELGTKWDLFGERLSLTSALFRIEKTNVRNRDPITGQVTALDGEQRVHGFELGATGSVTPAWKVFGSYTWLDGKVVSSRIPSAPSGSRMDNTPKHTLSLWTTYRLPSQVDLGLGAKYVDERINAVGNNQTVVTVDDYWRLDAMVSYALSKGVDLKLNVINLTDERYIEQVASGQGIPGAARTALFTLNYRQ